MTLIEIAEYLEQYANAKHKAAAADLRAYDRRLKQLEKEARSLEAAESDRRYYEEAQQNSLSIQTGGY